MNAKITKKKRYFQILKTRNLEYIQKLETKERKLWRHACIFCKESKLSTEEIKIIEEDYIFNTEPCTECKTNYNLSKYI